MLSFGNLCKFLEEQATIFKKLLMEEAVLLALSGNKQEDKKIFSNCGSDSKSYPVYQKQALKSKTKEGKERMLSRIIHCLAFKDGNDKHKKDLIKIIKSKHPVC